MIIENLKLIHNIFKKVPFFLLKTVPKAKLMDLKDLFNSIDKYSEYMRFLDLHKQTKIRDVYLAELFGMEIEKVNVPFGSIDEETGKPNQAEPLFVNVVARYVHAKNIFEFGSYMGRTTYYLSLASEDAFVTTLDLPVDQGSKREIYHGVFFKGTDRENRIRQIFCDSHKFDPSPYKGKMDFIFVDGDHSYEGVKNDTEKAFEMLSPGGCIMWHDYGARNDLGLVKYFVEFTEKKPLFRIRKTSLLLYLDGVNSLNYNLNQMRKNPRQPRDI